MSTAQPRRVRFGLVPLSLACALLATAACSTSTGAAQDAGAFPDGGTSSASPEVTCDPLAPPPTTLMNVLGIGKDAQGALYVADLPPAFNSPRLFISDGSTLHRAHVVGAGQEGSGGSAAYTLNFEILGKPASASQSLILQMNGATAGAMSLSGDPKSFSGGTPLTLVDAGAVAGMTIANLPGVVDYAADVEDGTVIVITSSMEQDPVFAPHLFYGPKTDAIERAITSFNQARSGYPRVTFTVGAATYTMAISGSSSGVPGTPTGPGPGTLTTDGGTLAFTVRTPTPTTLDGVAFECFAP